MVNIHFKLISLRPLKAPGPENIPNHILKDFADILENPLSVLLNSSFQFPWPKAARCMEVS